MLIQVQPLLDLFVFLGSLVSEREVKQREGRGCTEIQALVSTD